MKLKEARERKYSLFYKYAESVYDLGLFHVVTSSFFYLVFFSLGFSFWFLPSCPNLFEEHFVQTQTEAKKTTFV